MSLTHAKRFYNVCYGFEVGSGLGLVRGQGCQERSGLAPKDMLILTWDSNRGLSCADGGVQKQALDCKYGGYGKAGLSPRCSSAPV